MGFVNKILGGIMGGQESKPIAVPEAVKPADPVAPADTKSAADIAAEEEAKKKAALVALNAGGAQGTTVGGGNADVTRKILLGL